LQDVIKNNDVLSGNLSDEELLSLLEITKTKWKIYYRINSLRVSFRDKFICLECRDDGHEHQIRSAQSYISRYETLLRKINATVTNRVNWVDGLKSCRSLNVVVIDDKSFIKHKKLERNHVHKKQKTKTYKKKKRPASKLYTILKDIWSVSDEAFLNARVIEVKEEQVTLDKYDSILNKLNISYWVHFFAGHPDYQQKSFFDFYNIQHDSDCYKQYKKKHPIIVNPLNETRRLRELYIKCIQDYKYREVDLDKVALSIRTKLKRLKSLLLNTYNNQAEEFIKLHISNFYMKQVPNKNYPLICMQYDKLIGYYDINLDILSTYTDKMFVRLYDKSPDHDELRLELKNYIIDAMKDRSFKVAKRTTKIFTTQCTYKELIIAPDLVSFDSVFTIKSTPNLEWKHYYQYIKDFLLGFTFSAYYWSLRNCVSNFCGPFDYQLCLSSVYHEMPEDKLLI
jgi:hypothetical protein